MSYTSIIGQLRAASLFDLFHLRAALTMQLEDPPRIERGQRASLRASLPVASAFYHGDSLNTCRIVPMFHDVQALVDFTTQFKHMKIATKEDRFARRARFGASFGGGMLYNAARKTPPDGFADVLRGREVN